MEEDYYYSQEQKPDKKNNKPSKAWYLVPLFFGILGGIVGYLAVKDDDKKMAKKLLIAGLLISLIPGILIVGSVIAYYGIFTPSTLMGPTARGFGEIQVLSPWTLAASDGQINLNLANRVGQDVRVERIAYTIDSVTLICEMDKTIGVGEESLVSCTPRADWVRQNVGDSYTATVTIHYAYSGGNFDTSGTITGMYS